MLRARPRLCDRARVDGLRLLAEEGGVEPFTQLRAGERAEELAVVASIRPHGKNRQACDRQRGDDEHHVAGSEVV